MSDKEIEITGKTVLGISVLGLVLVASILYLFTPGRAAENGTPTGDVVAEEGDLIGCLEQNGVRIYGAEWCPACSRLAESLGGYDVVDPIWVECTDEQQRCQQEMHGSGVPEIQINGQLYQGSRDPEAIAEEVGCSIS